MSRIYITLNEKKVKDKVILDYLRSTYSEQETIKSVMYQYVVNGCNWVQIGEKIDIDNLDTTAQKDDNRCKTMQKDLKEDGEVKIDKDIISMFD